MLELHRIGKFCMEQSFTSFPIASIGGTWDDPWSKCLAVLAFPIPFGSSFPLLEYMRRCVSYEMEIFRSFDQRIWRFNRIVMAWLVVGC